LQSEEVDEEVGCWLLLALIGNHGKDLRRAERTHLAKGKWGLRVPGKQHEEGKSNKKELLNFSDRETKNSK